MEDGAEEEEGKGRKASLVLEGHAAVGAAVSFFPSAAVVAEAEGTPFISSTGGPCGSSLFLSGISLLTLVVDVVVVEGSKATLLLGLPLAEYAERACDEVGVVAGDNDRTDAVVGTDGKAGIVSWLFAV